MDILESWEQIKTLAYQVQQVSKHLEMASTWSASKQPSSMASITTENIYQLKVNTWKMKDLPEYSGKSMNQFHTYNCRCNNTFKLQPEKFANDEVKI